MNDDSQRSYLPWVMAALVLVVGGAKVDAARPLVASALAVAIPIVPVVIAARRVEDGGTTLERAAVGVGWVTILAGEICVAGGFLGVGSLAAGAPLARAALYLAGAVALGVHTLEARNLGKPRFAGYIGIAAAFAIYLSTHVGKDPFASVFGALFIAIAAGGGAGLLIGELLARVFKKA